MKKKQEPYYSPFLISFALFIATVLVGILVLEQADSTMTTGSAAIVDTQRKAQNQTKPLNTVEEFGPTETLPDFPGATVLPLPKSATVTRNIKTTSPQGKVQLTKILESPKSLQENYDYFENLFSNQKYGWNIINEVPVKTGETHAAIFANNNDGILSVNLDYNSVTKKTSIDLSFLKN